ncbi:MAG: hypothetical protein ABFS14_06810 [Gemmatimonadota bacterium]
MTLRTLRVSSPEETAAALETFNGFHDGFMKRIAIFSQDRIEPDRSQTCSGVFDVEIDFAHYNYESAGSPLQEHDRVVRARFERVQDLYLDLQQGFVGNTIQFLTAHAGSRCVGGGDALEDCICLRLGRSFFLEAARKWETRETQLFTFTSATFTEI